MFQDKLRVGIAGYGVVGKRRREFIDKHPHLKTVAVCDQTFLSEGIFDDGVACFTHFSKLLNEKLDVLFVCLTNDIAAEVTVLGLKKNLHVFCEKPPGRNLEDITKVLIYSLNCPNLKLKYGFNHRYHDSVKEALRIIRSGELGQVIDLKGSYGKSKIIQFDSSWRSQRSIAGGGILLDQGIHLVDMMRLFAGEFTQVHSFISNAYWKHDIEDNAYALMKTGSGVVGMLHSSATQWRHRFNFEITLTKGALILSGILSGSKSYGAETLTVVYANEDDGGDPREVMIRYNQDNSWQEEIFEFTDSILENKEIKNGSVKEAFETMKLVYQIYCADSIWKSKYNLTSQIPETLLEKTV